MKNDLLLSKRKLYDSCKNSYYNSFESELTDEEFDELELWLIANDPEFVPYVGTSNKEDKHKHHSPMLSLSKVSLKVIDDSEDFDTYTSEMNHWKDSIDYEDSFLWVPKYDGCSVNIQYKSGKLQKAITRGDKIQGRDVKNRLVNTIPDKLISKLKQFETLEIRGEIVLSKTVFEEKYSQFKNPRNLVSGFLSQKDIDTNISYDLTFIPFDIRSYSSGKLEHIDILSNIENLKLDFPKSSSELPMFQRFDDFGEGYKFYKDYRPNCDFWVDGIVVSVDSDQKEKIGYSETYPKWAKAIKFPPKTTITRIVDIKWSLGKTGEFTPIAQVEPIELDGTTVSNASLYNLGYVQEKGISIGSKVSIEKAGEIIPTIKIVLEHSNTPSNHPKNCPHCNSKLSEEDIHLFCRNLNCNGILEKRFVSMTSLLKIDFLGGETSKKIFSSGMFSDVFDLIINFRTKKSELISRGILPKGKIINSLENSFSKLSSINLETVIELMGDDGLGTRMSKMLAKYHSNVDYDFSGFEKRLINKYTIDPDNPLPNVIKRLEDSGIKINYIVNTNINNKIVELTGSPKTFGFKTKEEFLKQIESFNFSSGELKSGTFALITDDKTSTSSKMKKAQKLGIPIYEYKEFIEQFCK